LRFWSAYPRKVKREAALAAWLLVAPDAALEARILAAVEVQKHTAQWRDRGAIPNADNWLVDGRWTDEVSEGSFTTGKDYAAIERQKAAQREREQAVLSQQAPTIEALRPEIRKLAGPRNRGTDARK
jgi:hypothetical protein